MDVWLSFAYRYWMFVARLLHYFDLFVWFAWVVGGLFGYFGLGYLCCVVCLS